MQLSETENIYPAKIVVRDGVVSREMLLLSNGVEFSFDQTTAAEFMPILEHFIKTGELPE